MKIKIETDHHNEVNLNKAIRNEDIDPVSQKINTIIQKAQKIIKKQAQGIHDENESYILQTSYINSFVYLTILQIFMLQIIFSINTLLLEKALFSAFS